MDILAAKFFGASLHFLYFICFMFAALVIIHKTPPQDKRFTNPVYSEATLCHYIVNKTKNDVWIYLNRRPQLGYYSVICAHP